MFISKDGHYFHVSKQCCPKQIWQVQELYQDEKTDEDALKLSWYLNKNRKNQAASFLVAVNRTTDIAYKVFRGKQFDEPGSFAQHPYLSKWKTEYWTGSSFTWKVMLPDLSENVRKMTHGVKSFFRTQEKWITRNRARYTILESSQTEF